jgi:hypothetical protein
MKTPDRHIPTYSAELFTWYGFAESGSTEASDLGLRAGKQPGEQVWNDSCDVGFFVQGRREKRLYTQVGEKRHPDGEFMAWEFADVDRPGNKIFVYND